jgi:hypothetical protein
VREPSFRGQTFEDRPMVGTRFQFWGCLIGIGLLLGNPTIGSAQADSDSEGSLPGVMTASNPEFQRPVPMTGHRPAPPWGVYGGWEFVLLHPGTAWHAGYYHPAWGLPVALVVPPRARFEAQYGWGVGGSRSAFIGHQFSRNYPGPGQIYRQGLRPAPRWISDTSQFGVYAVRGPW